MKAGAGGDNGGGRGVGGSGEEQKGGVSGQTGKKREPVAMGEGSMEEEKQQKKARGMIQGRIQGREA